jgi:hypothetical protein
VAAVRGRGAARAGAAALAAATAALGLHARRDARLGRWQRADAGRRPRRRHDPPAGEELDPDSGDVLAGLLHAWGDRAGGALINTSFNGPGKPIVSSAADAVACFRRLGLDFLVLDDELLASDGGWWRRRA